MGKHQRNRKRKAKRFAGNTTEEKQKQVKEVVPTRVDAETTSSLSSSSSSTGAVDSDSHSDPGSLDSHIIYSQTRPISNSVCPKRLLAAGTIGALPLLHLTDAEKVALDKLNSNKNNAGEKTSTKTSSKASTSNNGNNNIERKKPSSRRSGSPRGTLLRHEESDIVVSDDAHGEDEDHEDDDGFDLEVEDSGDILAALQQQAVLLEEKEQKESVGGDNPYGPGGNTPGNTPGGSGFEMEAHPDRPTPQAVRPQKGINKGEEPGREGMTLGHLPDTVTKAVKTATKTAGNYLSALSPSALWASKKPFDPNNPYQAPLTTTTPPPIHVDPNEYPAHSVYVDPQSQKPMYVDEDHMAITGELSGIDVFRFQNGTRIDMKTGVRRYERTKKCVKKSWTGAEAAFCATWADVWTGKPQNSAKGIYSTVCDRCVEHFKGCTQEGCPHVLTDGKTEQGELVETWCLRPNEPDEFLTDHSPFFDPDTATVHVGDDDSSKAERDYW